MPRVIVRYSINREGGNQTGNAIRKAVGNYGVGRIGTGALEGEGSLDDMVNALRDVLDLVENPPGDGEVDHVWIYLDNPPPDSN